MPEPGDNIELIEHDWRPQELPRPTVTAKRVLWKLYLSHTLSAWNARASEFGAVIFLATIFPGTLFYTSLYALCRSAAAAILSSWIGRLVDRTNRLNMIRHTILWQRCSVAVSCLLLLVLSQPSKNLVVTYACFAASAGLACVEKMAFIGNTVSVERDWVIVVADSISVARQDLNSSMRRIDLVCKLIAPLAVSLVDAYSTKVAICVILGQNMVSVVFEYFAIAQVFYAVPELAHRTASASQEGDGPLSESDSDPATSRGGYFEYIRDSFQPYKDYLQNPAFLASFALSLLYLTVLSFGSQMVTYLLTLKFTSFHISIIRVAAVVLELSATCIAPMLMQRIGPIRSGLWFINEQVVTIALAVGLFAMVNSQTKLAGAALIFGVTLSRLGLWGFDLCVQFLVQEDAPADSRGSFSAIEVALQNIFELVSFVVTMIFYRPEDFKYPIFISAGAIAVSAACFAGFVRQKRGHLLHASKCFKREATTNYQVLPTAEEGIQ